MVRRRQEGDSAGEEQHGEVVPRWTRVYQTGRAALYVSGVYNFNHMLMNATIDEYVTHPTFTNYNLRVTEPKLCDTTVKQHSGYLDIAEDKHLFFW